MSATRQSVEPGDVIVVNGRRVGERARHGEILDVLGRPERPHFVVQWDDGHESILYPGETTTIEQQEHPARAHPQSDLAAATRILVDVLCEAEVQFEILPHRRTVTAAAEARALGVLPQDVAKTVIARTDEGVHVRVVVPATSHVSYSKLARAVAAPTVDFLTEADLVNVYPQFELGAVPPFGGPSGDRVVVDRTLLEHDHVVFDGGVHEVSLRMRTEDLVELAEAELVDVASR
jgi:Ala-tRNA(Pro) deacylase